MGERYFFQWIWAGVKCYAVAYQRDGAFVSFWIVPGTIEEES